MYLYILLGTAIIYYIFITLDDKRNLRLHNPPTTLTMKLTYLFFSFILSAVLVHLILGGKSFYDGSGGGEDLLSHESAHLRNIVQEVEVGLPDF